jgi:hypothetical protein
MPNTRLKPIKIVSGACQNIFDFITEASSKNLSPDGPKRSLLFVISKKILIIRVPKCIFSFLFYFTGLKATSHTKQSTEAYAFFLSYKTSLGQIFGWIE